MHTLKLTQIGNGWRGAAARDAVSHEARKRQTVLSLRRRTAMR